MAEQEDNLDDKLTASLKQATSETPEVTRVAQGEIALIQVPDIVRCMRCSDLMMLTPKQLKKYKRETGIDLLYNQECHYSMGNPACPAKQVAVSEYVDHEHVVSLYVSALETGNAERLASILTRINSKDEVTAKFLMDKIREATSSKPSQTLEPNTEFTKQNNQSLSKQAIGSIDEPKPVDDQEQKSPL